MTKLLTAEEDPEPDGKLSLGEHATQPEKRVTMPSHMTVRSVDRQALQRNLQVFLFFPIDSSLWMTYNSLCKRLHYFCERGG